MRWLPICLLAGLAAGCAQSGSTWSKAGVSDEDRQRDMVDCRRQAEAEAARESFATGARTPIFEVDPNTGQLREVFRPQRQSAELSEKSRSQALFNRCMQARGYGQG